MLTTDYETHVTEDGRDTTGFHQLWEHRSMFAMRFEALFYAHAGRIIEGYNGGLWEFPAIPDAPEIFPGVPMFSAKFCGDYVTAHACNYAVSGVSGEAAGCAALVLAVNAMEWQTSESNPQLSRRFTQWRERLTEWVRRTLPEDQAYKFNSIID